MQDRVVIITRGGTGIGRAAAIQFAESESPWDAEARADEVAAWIVTLANPAANWITGQVIAVDGGLSIT